MPDSDPLQSVEVTASSLEEAIDQGLQQLGLTRDDVIIEIMEEGSRGVLGMGTRNAVVRLTPLKRPNPPAPVIQQKPAPPVESSEESIPQVQEPPEAPEPPSDVTQPPPAPVVEPEPTAVEQPTSPEPEVESEPESTALEPRYVQEDEDVEYDATLGKEALTELLAHMDIEADINVYRAEAESPSEDPPWILDVRGEDLGPLIGRHGDTLKALQYITRLIVSRELQRRANIVVDVEGYKARRESALRKLAQRMARQAIERGTTVSLEPMPPNERRIIHITLREDEAVRTESIGSGDARKVTIIPTNQ